jgi:hypothetical protein
VNELLVAHPGGQLTMETAEGSTDYGHVQQHWSSSSTGGLFTSPGSPRFNAIRSLLHPAASEQA